jgi:hypothetical protein
MKKVCVCIVLSLVAIVWTASSATALPPFNKEWTGKYVEGNGNAKFVEAVGTAKCNVCHVGTSKKDRNEYGMAVSKFLTKAKYNEIKDDEAVAKKYILEGLDKAAAEKSGAGKSYGELIKSGELPGGAG